MNTNVREQAIIDKLQRGVATYLRCGGIVNNRIKKGLLLSLPVKKIKSVNVWQSCRLEGGCLVHFVRLTTTLLHDEEFTGHREYNEKQLLSHRF